MSIQFIDEQVLFRGDRASFCADFCVCDDPVDPPPVDPGTSCTTCKSKKACAHSFNCTPTTLKVTLADTEKRTACIECGTGGSIKVTAGTLDGSYNLTQNPANPCHWFYETDAATLVATGYIGAACTSTATLSTKLIIEAHRDSTGVDLIAFIRIEANDTHADFIVFSGRYALATKTNLPSTFAVAASSAVDDSECLGWQQGLGGRLGWDGTATVLVCPVIPHVCSCHDDFDCLWVKGIVIPEEVDDFEYSVCQDDDAPLPAGCTKTSVYVPFNITCEWITGEVSVGGVDNLKVKIHWYNVGDEHAIAGCGYYLFLYAVTDTEDILKALYYLDSLEPYGQYTLVDTELDDFPYVLVVEQECDDPDVVIVAPTVCPDSVPSALVASGWETADYPVCIFDTFPLWDGVLLPDGITDCTYIAGDDDLTLTEDGLILHQAKVELGTMGDIPAWIFTIYQHCAPPTNDILVWRGYKLTGLTPIGTYHRDETISYTTGPTTIDIL